MGSIILLLVILIELGMMGYSIAKRENIKTERAYVRIVEFLLLVVTIVTGIIEWSFQIKGMCLVLLLLTIYSVVVLVKKFKGSYKAKEYKTGRTILHAIQMIFLIGFSVVPLLIFPQYKLLETTGKYECKTATYTWTDESRQETLSGKEEARNVTVNIYYPSEYKDGTTLDAAEAYPLIVFSHGAFGYIMSNYSLYEELASNGYVVCSISHTYHAFFTQETNGNLKLVNTEFIQEAIDATNGLYDTEDEFELEQKWMKVRTGDVNFVLDTIETMVQNQDGDEAVAHINLDEIGLIGHSLGGATSVEIARERNDIDAVVVLDGTHIGERIGIENGEFVYNEEPLEVPVLDIRAEEHTEGVKGLEYQYVNNHTISLNPENQAVTILGTAHMNFTDLPMFSPFLAGMLGMGDCDPTACIEKIDSIALQWFNYYLKGDNVLEIQEVYEID